MLDAAAELLGNRVETLHCGNFGDAMPGGLYDLVISSLAIHHLEDDAKRELYRQIAVRLRVGGRFVQGDIRSDGNDSVTFADNDIPAPGHDMVEWMRNTGLDAEMRDEFASDGSGPGDLCIIVADKPLRR